MSTFIDTFSIVDLNLTLSKYLHWDEYVRLALVCKTMNLIVNGDNIDNHWRIVQFKRYVLTPLLKHCDLSHPNSIPTYLNDETGVALRTKYMETILRTKYMSSLTSLMTQISLQIDRVMQNISGGNKQDTPPPKLDIYLSETTVSAYLASKDIAILEQQQLEGGELAFPNLRHHFENDVLSLEAQSTIAMLKLETDCTYSYDSDVMVAAREVATCVQSWATLPLRTLMNKPLFYSPMVLKSNTDGPRGMPLTLGSVMARLLWANGDFPGWVDVLKRSKIYASETLENFRKLQRVTDKRHSLTPLLFPMDLVGRITTRYGDIRHDKPKNLQPTDKRIFVKQQKIMGDMKQLWGRYTRDVERKEALQQIAKMVAKGNPLGLQIDDLQHLVCDMKRKGKKRGQRGEIEGNEGEGHGHGHGHNRRVKRAFVE